MCDIEHNEIALEQLLCDGYKEECTKNAPTSTWAHDQKKRFKKRVKMNKLRTK